MFRIRSQAVITVKGGFINLNKATCNTLRITKKNRAIPIHFRIRGKNLFFLFFLGKTELPLGGCPRIVIFSQIEECEKNCRRYIVDIPRIIF